MSTMHRARWGRMVRRHRRLLAGCAAALSIGTLGLALQPPADPTRPVVVAAADLPAGRSLTPGDLVVARVAAGVLPLGTFPEADDLVGEVLAAPVIRGEALGAHRILAPPGWSVPADTMPLPVRFTDAAAARLLRPGQRIDVLATSDPGLDEPGFAAAELIAAEILVLAVVEPQTGDGLLGAGPAGTDSSALVLLAADRVSALAIAGAQARAHLTFAIRPAAGGGRSSAQSPESDAPVTGRPG